MGIIIRQSIKGTIVNYVGIAIGFFTTFFVLTRFLTAEEIGLTRVLIEAATLIAGLAQLGTNSSIVRFYPYFKDETHKDHGFFFWSLAVPLVGFLVVGTLYVCLKSVICGVFSEKSSLFVNYYYFVLPLAFFLLYMTIFETNANVLMRIVVPKFVREVVVRVLLLASYLLYAFKVLDIDGFVAAFCSIYGVAMLINIGYLLSLKRISIKPDLKFFSKSLRKDYLLYTLFLVTASIGSVITPSVNTFFISAKMGLEYTGVFAIATFIAALIEIPYRSLGAISQPQLSQEVKDRDVVQANQLVKKVSLHQLLVGAFIFFIIWINIDLLFKIIPNGELYATAKQVVLILGITKLLQSICNIGVSALGYSRYYYYSLIFTFVLTVAAIVFNNWLIPLWGINGAAMASLLAAVIYYALLLGMVHRKIKINLFSMNQFKVLAIILMLLPINFLLETYVSPLWNYLFSNDFVIEITDAILRTGILTVLGVVIVYFWHISEDVNSLIRKTLRLEK